MESIAKQLPITVVRRAKEVTFSSLLLWVGKRSRRPKDIERKVDPPYDKSLEREKEIARYLSLHLPR